jgi:AraC-like DNA-binding protein
VQLLIREALPSGIPSVLQIGRHMGMSGRTLKRRLAENGLTFRSLIQRTQEDIARSLLRNSDCSIGEIAFQAGYSEQSAFNRAFKRWTGQPPLEFRKG